MNFFSVMTIMWFLNQLTWIQNYNVHCSQNNDSEWKSWMDQFKFLKMDDIVLEQ